MELFPLVCGSRRSGGLALGIQMTPSSLAQEHYRTAMEQARGNGLADDAVARAFLSLALGTFLAARSIADVRQELLGTADNLDPDTDYPFMRP